MKRTAIYKICACITVLLILAVSQIYAQTPAPDSETLSLFLQKVVTNFVAFKITFINTVEGTLGGYFAVLAYILAWIIAVFYFIQQFIRGEWDASQIGRFTGSIVVCLLLLVFCGDVDGDGHQGDIVRMPAYVGYYLAFGEDAAEPTGSYINRLVSEQRTKFNDNYQIFVENKLMVKINDQDMPVRYPGMSGIQTVAAVSIGQASAAQQNSIMSQEFQIGLLFQIMNFCRSVIEIVDFFLLVLYAFGILVCSIIAPFMVAPFVNRELRQRFTYPFMWTVMTVTIIFPALSQCFRYFAYLSANIALGTNGNPTYTFDPTTYTIIANGDPTPMVLVAVLTMLISIVLLVMSLVLSYSFAQGKLVESMGGLIANTFAGLSSVGIGAVVSSAAAKMTAEGETGVIDANKQTTDLLAGYSQKGQLAQLGASRTANTVNALGTEKAAVTGAVGDAEASQTSLLGQYLLGASNTRAGQFSAKSAAYTEAANQVALNNVQERDDLMKKSLSTYLDANRITDESDKQAILDQVGAINLKGDKLDNYWDSLGPVGSIGKQFFGGKTYEAVSGRAVINSNENYKPELPFTLPSGKTFSPQSFLEQGVIPNLNLQQPGVMPSPTGIGITGGGSAASADGTPLFKQGDARWSGTQLGSGLTMGEKGCAVTATAMALSKMSGRTITPPELDGYLDKNGGYTGNDINWGVAAKMVGGRGGKQEWKPADINKSLDEGNPVVVGVDRTGDGKTDHWMTLTGRGVDNQGRDTYLANDPATGKQMMLYPSGNQLAGGKYKTTGELRTFTGVANNFGGNAQRGNVLQARGIPSNIPPNLLKPLDSGLSRRAGNAEISNEGMVYYNPQQEAEYVSSGNQSVDNLILGAARTHGVNPNLLKKQFIQESRLYAGAVSRKGAAGVAQLMPGTATRVGVTNTKDPAQSIYGGAKYMRYVADYMVDKGNTCDGSQLRSLSLAGYNSGEGAVQRAGFKVPNISETKDYVSKISGAIDQSNKINPQKSNETILNDLNRYTRPEAEVMSKRGANWYGKETALRRTYLDNVASSQITRLGYADKRNIAAANMQMKYQTADTNAAMQMQGITESYNYSVAGTQRTLQARQDQAAISRNTTLQVGEISYQGGAQQAAFQYQGQTEAAQITQKAALDALYKRNMANLVQSVGGSAAHQLSELFERASKGF